MDRMTIFFRDIERAKELYKWGKDKYGANFVRFYKYIKKTLYNRVKMTEWEMLDKLIEYMQCYFALQIEAQKRNQEELDPILIAEAIKQDWDYDRIRGILEEEERFLVYEELLRKKESGFTIEEIISKRKELTIVDEVMATKLSHIQGVSLCRFRPLTSVRIPNKLWNALDILSDFNISTTISRLLIKHMKSGINVDEILSFNKKLIRKYPYLFSEKTNRTITLMLPAYFRYKVYIKKVNVKGLPNNKRGLVNLAGLLYYILFTKEYDLADIVS